MTKKVSKLIAVLIATLVVVMPLSAYASSLTVNTSSDKVSVGDEITITISLESATEAKSGGIEVSYDGSLALVSGSAEFKLSGTSLVNYDEKTNKGAFAFSNTQNVSGDILTLKFKARYDGTPNINVTLTLRNGNDVVLSESSTTSITVGSGVSPTGSDTTADISTANQTSAGDETTVVAGDVESGDGSATSTAYADADNSIFRRADGSLNITLIVLIIAIILIVITVLIVVRYNKKENEGSNKEDADSNEKLIEDSKSEPKKDMEGSDKNE